MRTAAMLLMIGVVAAPAAAQVAVPRGSQGIPPGQMPPSGQCRVWYEGVPPGRQPAATSCREAERTASRDSRARVIYGADANINRRSERNGYPYPNQYPNQYPNPYPYPNQYPSNRIPYPNRYPNGGAVYGSQRIAFDNGYKDGFDKGRDDGQDRKALDPTRQGRYRSADHGYDKKYGSKDQYKVSYRDGFEAGYQAGYRETNRYGGRSNNSRWPF